MTFNPMTFPLEADLSRADVRLLHKLCAGKSVVEFGCGGSTVLLGSFASRVISYDTDPSWISRTASRLSREPGHTCAELRQCQEGVVPDGLPPADVYFIDGWCPDRPKWVREVVLQGLTTLLVYHDSRSGEMTTLASALVYPVTLCLRSVEYHVEDSNMAVMQCGEGVKYVNWNEAEPENRLPFLS
jgi:hypothetical protein